MLQTVDLLAGNAGERSVSVAFSSVCRQLAYDIGAVCRAAASGHLGGSLSSLELMSTLYLGGHLRYDLDDPKHPQRDRVLMRGHLGPLRYPLFSLLGWVDDAELATYRRLGSRLHGHESMQHLPGVDITPSGSLGMVLSYGVGAALVSKNKPHPFTTYVFLGDGEEQEGNVSEAARFAANRGLGNLVCVLDQNGKQYSRPISDLNSQSDVAQTWRGYGWECG
jgi:transketolase